MPINRQFAPDLQSPAICEFTVKGDEYSEADKRRKDRAAEGFRSAGTVRDVPGYATNIVFPTYVRETVAVYTRMGRLIRNMVIEDFGYCRATLSAEAILSIRDTVIVSQPIEDAFTNTILDMAHIDEAENNLVRSGVNLQDYQVDLAAKLIVIERKELSANINEFIRVMDSQRDKSGNPVYHVKRLDKVERGCQRTTGDFPSDPIVVADDPNNPGDAIRDRVNQENQECDGLVPIQVDLGVPFKVPEFKTEWTVDEIWVCGVKLGETKIPHLYTRQRDMRLVGVVSSLDSVAQVAENAFKSCMTEAAAATSLLTLVTSGSTIGAAVTVFVSYVKQCLLIKLGGDLKCIVPDLFLVTGPDPGWSPV